jgi:hypothetical protein
MDISNVHRDVFFNNRGRPLIGDAFISYGRQSILLIKINPYPQSKQQSVIQVKS